MFSQANHLLISRPSPGPHWGARLSPRAPGLLLHPQGPPYLAPRLPPHRLRLPFFARFLPGLCLLLHITTQGDPAAGAGALELEAPGRGPSTCCSCAPPAVSPSSLPAPSGGEVSSVTKQDPGCT